MKLVVYAVEADKVNSIFDKRSLYPDYKDVVALAVNSCYAKLNPFGFFDRSSSFVSEFHSETWHQISIESGLNFKDILLQIPSADRYEIGGYITPDAIHYIRGSDDEVMSVSDQEIVFHTHPRSSDFADLPSHGDLFCFVMSSALRSIIIGNKKMIVMDKTPKFLSLIEEISNWVVTDVTDFMLNQSKDFSNEQIVESVHHYIFENFLKINPADEKGAWLRHWRLYVENLGIVIGETSR